MQIDFIGHTGIWSIHRHSYNYPRIYCTAKTKGVWSLRGFYAVGLQYLPILIVSGAYDQRFSVGMITSHNSETEDAFERHYNGPMSKGVTLFHIFGTINYKLSSNK